MNLSSIWQLLQDTIKGWQEDKVSQLAAALSYFTIFSIAPLLVIALSVAGIIVSRQEARAQIIQQVQDWTNNPESGEIVRQMIDAANFSPNASIIATVIGLGVLLFGATNFFFQLEQALNKIWNAQPEEGGIKLFLQKRLFSFLFVLGVGILLVASLIFNSVLSSFLDVVQRQADFPGIGILIQGVNILVSVTIVTLIFAIIFKVMPDKEIRWRDVFPGGLATALLFTLGQMLISIYFSESSVGSAYGAAGSLAVLLLWIYYSMQILLIGAEFTYAYAKRFGSLA